MGNLLQQVADGQDNGSVDQMALSEVGQLCTSLTQYSFNCKMKDHEIGLYYNIVGKHLCLADIHIRTSCQL